MNSFVLRFGGAYAEAGKSLLVFSRNPKAGRTMPRTHLSVPERGWPAAPLLRAAPRPSLPPTGRLTDRFTRKGVHGLDSPCVGGLPRDAGAGIGSRAATPGCPRRGG